jgi:hypothetical protein
MLPLQRKELELNPEDNSRESFPAAAPSDVLNSIEDLRRLIQEITLEEIRDAEEKASLMVRRLSSLQVVCANFAAIRQFVIRVEEARLHASEADSGGPEKKIPQQYSRNPDKPPEIAISSSGNTPLIKAEIDTPFQKAVPGPPSPMTNHQPAAPNPTREVDEKPTIGSKEDRPVTQLNYFTLGENRLGEKRFELGFSITEGGAEEKMSTLDKDHYAAIALTPEETPPPTFSFHRDQGSTELPAAPNVDKETMPGFFDEMINDFTAFVGPMAAVIVDEQVANLGEAFTAFPRSRLDELIALVSREILDDQSKVRFQKQMAEKIRTLTSQTPPASLRKKND